jgi:segregation and condensation protein B
MDGASPGTNLMTNHEDSVPVSAPPQTEADERRPADPTADDPQSEDRPPVALPNGGIPGQAAAAAPVPGLTAGGGCATPAESPPEILPHRVVEAILFSSDSPLPPQKIAQVMGVGTARDVRKHIETLNREYAERSLAFRVEEIAGGFQMLTLPVYNAWLTKLLRTRQETKLSQAALETLAIVAYKQPCTRADIEAIRGVAAGDLLQRLREMNLVKIVGRAEDLGRPLLYGTSKRFLEVFGLPSLEDLPQVEALAGGIPATAPRIAEQSPSAAEEEPPAAAASPGDIEGAEESAAGGMAVALDGHGFPDGMVAQGCGHATAPPEKLVPASGGTGVSPVDASPAQPPAPIDELSPAIAPPAPELDPAQLADAYAAAESNAAAARDAEEDDSPPADDRPRLTIVRETDESQRNGADERTESR